MLNCPLLPDALSAIAFAISMLMAISNRGSLLNPSMLKNNQFESVRTVV
jgi:hypothetical protein